MPKKHVSVSDHALVRYCERVKGVSLDFLRQDIEDKVRNAVKLGASGVKVDGVYFALDGAKVITCYETDEGRQRTVVCADGARRAVEARV